MSITTGMVVIFILFRKDGHGPDICLYRFLLSMDDSLLLFVFRRKPVGILFEGISVPVFVFQEHLTNVP